MSDLPVKHYILKSAKKVKLSRWKAGDTGAVKDKAAALKKLAGLREKLVKLQYRLSAGRAHKVLVILQGMDTAGKDGTIRHVFEGVNPQIVDVASFKVPSEEESAHDFLWRVHRKTPGKGEMVIFNRSHYEDVLAVRVHGLVPPKVWRKRFDHINDFERLLADEGTHILKFFLHIDEDEQKERLDKRLDDPAKRWKFSARDVRERALWPRYVKAYEDVLSRTSTAWAPWVVVPANKKWYRNLVVSTVLVDALARLNMKYPQPAIDIRAMKRMIRG